MRRIGILLSTVAAVVAGTTTSAASASASAVCAGPQSGCYHSLQAAVDAAPAGSVVHIRAGTFRGGVTINKDLRLVGAGAKRTAIRGGPGSVLTIGAYGASTVPSVSIEGVTIAGGVVRSSPESVPFVDEDGVWALGGGVEIPPNADFTGGATVTITNSVITRNRVAPRRTVDSGLPCPDGSCPFAAAAGGGIDSWGTLTLERTTVSDNRVGSASGLSTVASDSYSGAIQNWLGLLTIRNSTITGNAATATAPNGRFADSGAIFMEGGSLRMTDSSVTDNSAGLAASLPHSVDPLAIAGGVHISDQTSAIIRDTTISGNSTRMTNTVGDALASSGGLHGDVALRLSNATISHNTVTAATLAGSSGNANGDSGAGEIRGTIDNSRFTGNSVTVRSAEGRADAAAGAAILGGSMTNGTVNGNRVRASSPHGSAAVLGGGLQTDGGLTLRNTSVRANSADARGRTATARGGGIFAAAVPDGPPAGPLHLINSAITRNALTGNPVVTRKGGGLYTTCSVTLTNSTIRRNTPDNLFGVTRCAAGVPNSGSAQRGVQRPALSASRRSAGLTRLLNRLEATK